ncbi:MAG: nucleotidyl transferase AbiEii/AbiGii toxin family protein [Muribaculaceae bacterium]|nr:nucleotidyl transferase AbiEii/AbiGii toxin family protein [Muribaculaceae bacterium]
MNLHDNQKLFADAVLAAAQHLDINPIFIEKDYWITRSLKLMSEADPDGRAIFKGGISLSKAHFIGSKFSEDIDVAIVNADSLNGNPECYEYFHSTKFRSLGRRPFFLI